MAEIVLDEALRKKYFRDGILTTYPKKAEEREAILKYMVSFLDPTVSYSEIKLNFVLKKLCEDFPLIRRELVDHGYLNRDSFGKAYEVNPDKAVRDAE